MPLRINGMAKRGFLFFLVFFLSLCSLHSGSARDLVGWVEKATLHPENLLFHAKVDTGARNSSLNVSAITLFRRDSSRWVRFNVVDRRGKRLTLERPLVRVSTINRHFGKKQERPTVILSICIGKTRRDVEVNLTDRTGLNYQMLIGRSFIREHFLVDPGKTFLTEPSCSIGDGG